MRIFILFLLFLLTSFSVDAQRANRRSKSELGIMLGGSYYIGDLNQFGHFKNTNLAGGLVYRYNVHSRMALRANVMYGSVEAYDSQSKNPLLKNRNLDFQSEIYEGAVGVEFNYFPFQLGHDRYRATGYLLAEIGLFHMNPTTTLNGDEIELQSLGTEGQGSSLSSKGYYNKTQLTIPLAVGFKFSIGKNIGLNLEYGIRKTFTDYLDDVGSNNYVNPSTLAVENGPLAAQLSNRSLDGSRFGKRGNATTKDWYTFFGVMLTIRLGQPDVCFHH